MARVLPVTIPDEQDDPIGPYQAGPHQAPTCEVKVARAGRVMVRPIASIRACRMLLVTLISLAVTATACGEPPVSFNGQIRPILSDKCFQCHGPDQAHRRGGLRLDRADSLFQGGDSGPALVAGDPELSEIWRRIEATDPDQAMPPPDTGKTLTPAERAAIRQWIQEGAAYQEHWAFQRVERPAIPETAGASHPIDCFVREKLRQVGLTPAAEAPRETLIRRVTLDLTGLPPTLTEIDAFLADRSPNAYEKVVDRLLMSPHYGERMAQSWLDYARYADSHGFQVDSSREMSAWRDWVISAFNQNMPFDQFTIEQLAGDLLPHPTRDQIVATGFHRNVKLNGEGGRIQEEWFAETVIDRVETTGLTWMGLTLNCCRCHDHKYDPISQKEFYQLFAFFNSVDETGVLDQENVNTSPVQMMTTPDQEQRLAELRGGVTTAETHLAGLKSLATSTSKDGATPSQSGTEPTEQAEKSLQEAKEKLKEYEKSIPSVMVMRELATPRPAFLLKRGQYDQPGEEVTREVPQTLPRLPEGVPRNRLGFAQWLVSRDHPLTARVWVNRAWEQFFRVGLVSTSENLGSQAESPSHPELLDWLAAEFMEGGNLSPVTGNTVARWDMKGMHKLMVMSATYRQSAQDSWRVDPDNRLLSRGPRFRLSAEVARDQALAVAGLLARQIGGHSVRPYMPDGVWDETSRYGDLRNYQADRGAGLYRRSLYTIWKRTAPPPSLMLFDASAREVCTVKRSRTNTPLQALALLNEVTYVEAARKLGERMRTEGGGTVEDRLGYGFRLATARHPTREELSLLVAGFRSDWERFNNDPAATQQFLNFGQAPPYDSTDRAELAAYALTANVLLNMDEVITRE